ncbi:hypothetical protein D3C77_427060 [compost metagenome]
MELGSHEAVEPYGLVLQTISSSENSDDHIAIYHFNHSARCDLGQLHAIRSFLSGIGGEYVLEPEPNHRAGELQLGAVCERDGGYF